MGETTDACSSLPSLSISVFGLGFDVAEGGGGGGPLLAVFFIAESGVTGDTRPSGGDALRSGDARG